MQIKLSERNILLLPAACSAFAIKIRSPVAGLINARAEQLLQHHIPHIRTDWDPLLVASELNLSRLGICCRNRPTYGFKPQLG